MDKNSISFTNPEVVTFVWKGQMIKVDPIIPLPNQVRIIKKYAETLLQEGDFIDNYFSAEWYMILTLVDENTNIKISEAEDNVELNDLITSGLWYEIRQQINMFDFETSLHYIVSALKEQKDAEKTLSFALNTTISKVNNLIDNVSKIDLSEEGINRLVDTLRKETADYTSKFGS